MPIFNPTLIKKGGGVEPTQPLDPVQAYHDTRPADWLPMPTGEQVQDNEIYLLFHIPQGLSSLIAFTVTCTGSYTVALGTMNDGVFTQSSTQSIVSGSKYENVIEAADFGDVTSTGQAQCMIKISGTDILTFAPATHSKKTLPGGFTNWNIVELAGRLPQATDVRVGNSTSNLALQKLAYFTLYGNNAITDMSYMFYYCYSLTTIPQLNTSQATNMSYIFSDCYSLLAIPQLNTSQVTNMSSMFSDCHSLVAIPQLNTSQVTSMRNMFGGCSLLTAIPELDTSQVTDMSSMFGDCYSLTTIPQLDTAMVTNMRNMFGGCYSLTTIPQLDTTAATDMSYMFSDCHALTAIPQLSTSQVTNMSYMFSNCYSLIAIPQLSTSQVTDMGSMFRSCYSLTTIPQLNASQVTDMSYMFYYCYSLIVIPQLDTAMVTDMNSMFRSCYSLTTIPQLDTSQVTDMDMMFYYCFSLQSVSLDSTVTSWGGYAIDLSGCLLLRDGIIALFNSLPTITTGKELTLIGNPGVTDLTDEDKAIATDKGWTLTL